MNPSRRRRGAVLLALLLAALLLPAAPAGAHEGDPRLVTVLDEVRPALPASVIVQAQAGLAAQLVAQNPTQTELEVLGTGGRPFLRLSDRGVFGDVAAPDFLTTANPNGATPREAGSATPRWVRISSGDSWGWYDHRLHPAALRAPADQQRQSRLAEFTVPLRYGTQPVTVRGHVQFRPLLGTFTVSADPAPAGLVVQALPGRLPGVFLSNPERRPLTVLGRDGEPFLRFGARGVEVNVASRTHVEDRQARGLPAGPPSPTPSFRLVTPGGSSYTWLDDRLRYPQELPPDPVLRAVGPTVVDRWEVPVEAAAPLTGEIRWVPEAAAAQEARQRQDAGRDLRPVAVVATAALALLTAVFVLRRRRI